MAATETDRWAGAELAAARNKKKGLTQEKLAELSGIARETIVKLETGERRISPYYAEKLAPHLGVKDHRKLLPPEEQPHQPSNPLARLAELEGEVARLRGERDFALREVVVRLAAVEAAQEQLVRQATPRSNRTTEK